MRTMRNQRQVTVRVAPEAVAEVQQRLTDIMADYPGITFVEVAADARLRRGGCILESELGVVDASLDVQLEALSRALRSAFSRTL
jgi:type III secretion protein L